MAIKIFEFLGRCFFEKKYPEKLTLNWKSIITRRACGKRRVDLIRQFREFIGLKIGMLSCRFRARPVGDCFAEDEFFDSPVVITAAPKVCRKSEFFKIVLKKVLISSLLTAGEILNL